MMRRIRNTLDEAQRFWNLPRDAKMEYLTDHWRVPRQDPGIEKTVACAITWLCLAQDNSASQDGGVSEFYSLKTGWGPSYPETTGYIVPTMIKHARVTSDKGVRGRAKQMLDWLVSIQLPDGSFQGGNIWAQPRRPTVFNTGQVLLGLASGVREFGDEYREAMCRAADWLVNVQDHDGCWRKYASPFVVPGAKTYDVHAAWGLLEANRLEAGRKYAEAALANARWALTQQTVNGWFLQCCVDDLRRPLSHTLGYVVRGILEAFRYSGDPIFLEAARRTSDSLLKAMQTDGFLAGRFFSNWQAAEPWACLTGTVQMAYCWLLLYCLTGEERYRDAAQIANQYVRRTVCVSGPRHKKGGIKGAFPIDGAYADYCYISWGCKFFVDANLFEKEMRENALDLDTSCTSPIGVHPVG